MLTCLVPAGGKLVHGEGTQVFQTLEDPGTGSQGDWFPWSSEAGCARRAGAGEKGVPGSRPDPHSIWSSLKIQGVWGQGRSGFLICGSMVRYGRKLAVLGVRLRNITESILGVDLGGFGSFTVRI